MPPAQTQGYDELVQRQAAAPVLGEFGIEVERARELVVHVLSEEGRMARRVGGGGDGGGVGGAF